MDRFGKAMDMAIDALIKMDAEWERIEPLDSDRLAQGYPFPVDFRTMVHQFIDWREKLRSE